MTRAWHGIGWNTHQARYTEATKPRHFQLAYAQQVPDGQGSISLVTGSTKWRNYR